MNIMVFSKLKQFVRRCWDSPTLMTWGSFVSKSLTFLVVLPFLLTSLSTAEISLWYLFMTVFSLQLVFDVGFSPTFTRVIAYAMGGATVRELNEPFKKCCGELNTNTIRTIYSTMRVVYVWLGTLWTILLATGGTLAMIRPIGEVVVKTPAWIAWGVIVAVSFFALRGNLYSSYLQGMNQIALLRRWDIITSMGAILTSLLVIFGGGGLLGLVLSHQGWQVISVLRNRWLAMNIENSLIRSNSREPFSKDVFSIVWPSVWRSGLGIMMSNGVIQASGILYAQFGETTSVASYLFGLRLIQTVSQFSQAPFYSKLPLMARLYAENKHSELVQIAKLGMAYAHWTFVTGFIALGLIGAPLLIYIGSNAAFPDHSLWSIMGASFFIERYGAMHIQLYSTTNRIIWHIANGFTGLIYISLSLMLFGKLGVLAFPLGMLLGYLSFYSWYTAIHAYRTFKMNFFVFERGTAFIPFIITLVYISLYNLL
jgi:hypothetical protein